MNALEIVQQTTDELALQRPTVVIGSQDPQIRQLLALLNRLGTDLCRQYEWEKLDREHIITTVSYNFTGDTVDGSPVITNIPSTAGLSDMFQVNGIGVQPFAQILSVDSPTQVTLNMPAQITQVGAALQFAQVEYPLPSDWNSQIEQTEWDRNNRWALMGPQSPQDWQSFKSGIVYAGPRQRFRIWEGRFVLNPLPANGQVFAWEYISNAWARGLDGTPKQRFTADTDTCIYDDSLMVTGLKAQWKAAKGLDGTFDLGEFRNLLQQNKAQDKSAAKLSLSPWPASVLMTGLNVPDGNWPGR